jgi:A/G-specific adenine glycosylase
MLMEQGKVLLEKRPVTGIWGGLWCLPEMPLGEYTIAYCTRRFGMKVAPLPYMPPLDHTFTHFKLRIHPQPLDVVSFSPSAKMAETGEQGGVIWVSPGNALKAAIPTPVRKLLMQYGCPQSGQLFFEKAT